nr:tenascin-N [Mirounga angustirostris]
MGLQGTLCFPLGLLLGSVLLVASAPATLEPHGCSDKEQQVTVSHTYKIDVPKSALVQVETDPQPLSDDGASLLAPGEAEEQNIIFRHNIRLQTPQKDCELTSSVQELLARVKKLEEEMVEMKDKCDVQRCCQGAAGGSLHCSGHGTFSPETCTCRCEQGWEGAGCERPACPGACSGHGRCAAGLCECEPPYVGADCAYTACPDDCSGHGACVRGVCRCHEDFTSEDCSERRCPGDCSGHGFCDAGECYCEEGFRGFDCAQVVAPQGLQLLKSREDSLLVSWEPSSEVDHYLLSYYPLGTELSGKQIQVPKEQHTYDIAGLQPGTKYIVTLRNVKKAVSSGPQHLLATTDLAVLGTAWVTDETENSLDVEWENPPTEVDYYKLQYGPLTGQEVAEVTVPKSSDPKSRYDITGLQPGTEYKITVVPMKGELEGKPILLNGKTEIDSPQNLVTDRVTEDTATISWDPVQAVIDKYMVRYTSADGDTREVSVGKEQSSAILTGLRPGVEYTVQVWAQKGARESKKADTKALTDIDPPRNLRPSAVTQSGGVLTWTAPSAQIDGYILTYPFPDGTVKEVQLGRGDERLELRGLEQGITYPVSLVAFKGDRRSRNVSTTLSTVGVRFPHPSDCSQVQQNSNVASGLYTIYLHGDSSLPLQVYCDMNTDGGGWIVFQRRNTGQLDFFKRWRTYVEGFGDPMKEFWLGLDKLHNLTAGTPTRYEVRVDLQTANESAYAVYDSFQVASSKERYRLTVGKYRGTAGDALTYHNGWKFTTFDRDNDIALSNCALTHHGGWWYKNCHLANPNGRYGETKHSEGVNWEPWKGHEFSIPYVELKIRPHGYSGEHVLDRSGP